MKRWIPVLLVSISFLVPQAAPAAAKQDPKAAAEEALKAQRAKEAAALLNGTVWNVEMTSLSGEKGKKSLKDTLTFKENRVTSQGLTQEGFSPSNCTVTVEGDVVIWETMQSKEGGGVAFWRGERQGDTMRGILSKQPADGNNVDYSFSGKVSAPPPPPAPVVVPGAVPVPPAMTDATSQPPMTASAPGSEQPLPPPVVAPTAPPPAPPAPAPKADQKKKKGWWW
ncbi:MAG: hypothetical protein HYZ94_02545 [Candidatus Omnitrophica bacterium]|nr:hypothetical protein [Candidatus Omnitrophota bacterium]